MYKICKICKLALNNSKIITPTIWRPYIAYSFSNKPKLINCVKNHAVPIKNGGNLKTIIALSVLSWLGFADDDEEKESELIMTLKRAVLCTQREQFDKAEQLLHIALRLAQQQRNPQGITYCYDLMANLAFDQRDLDKAEKLFVSVLQRLLGDGLRDDDVKVIHISLKLARILHMRAEVEKADLGYQWCLTQIDKQKNKNFDARMLYGVIQDWYAQFLLDKGDVKTSMIHLKEAHRICSESTDKSSEQSMLLLNDLGITSWRAGDMEGAQRYLMEAISIGEKVDDKSHLGVIHANLGLLFLEKGITQQAEKYCKRAWQLGKRHENPESVEQANYCFEQIKLNLSK